MDREVYNSFKQKIKAQSNQLLNVQKSHSPENLDNYLSKYKKAQI